MMLAKKIVIKKHVRYMICSDVYLSRWDTHEMYVTAYIHPKRIIYYNASAFFDNILKMQMRKEDIK